MGASSGFQQRWILAWGSGTRRRRIWIASAGDHRPRRARQQLLAQDPAAQCRPAGAVAGGGPGGGPVRPIAELRLLRLALRFLDHLAGRADRLLPDRLDLRLGDGPAGPGARRPRRRLTGPPPAAAAGGGPPPAAGPPAP